ncbi:DKNYY domain-containing protein [Crateriforma spongiae]|uniref:DKNYY domain-containing protein n=1 Tax=Crateriforma spongiae TaxID=2724528 RepID=UPI0039AFBA92
MTNQDVPIFDTIDGKVLHYGRSIRGADPGTFRQVLGDWAKDKKYVYHGSLRTKIDTETFEPLNSIFARDANHAFLIATKLRDTDASEFRVLDCGQHPTNLGPGSGFLDGGYATDGNVVWCCCRDGLFQLKAADSATLVSLGNEFAFDKRNAYYGRTIIKGANRKTWRHWRGKLSIDDKNVFWCQKKVQGIDRYSVGLMQVRDSFADRNSVFLQDRKVEIEEYLEMLKFEEERCQWEREWLQDGRLFERMRAEWRDSY